MKEKIKKRSTMKDVAQRSGVSIGTVSHVLNGTASISVKTVNKVRKAMKELDYMPNTMARNMRTKKNKMIGLMVPKLTNSFYAQIASAFMDEADRGDYTVIILGYEYSLEREKKELDSLVQNNVGTIIIANGSDDEDYILNLIDKGVNVILADRRTELKGVSYVEFDNIEVMYDIVKLLKEKAYQKIGFISEPLSLINLHDRYHGYRMALEKYGYEYNENHVFISDIFRLDHAKNAYIYMKELLNTHTRQELPEVFIASSDLLAMGIMRAIIEKGYSIPGDFGIVGCDNLQISGYMQPALTTIDQNRDLLARELWNMAIGQINGEPRENVVVKQKLIIRESC